MEGLQVTPQPICIFLWESTSQSLPNYFEGQQFRSLVDISPWNLCRPYFKWSLIFYQSWSNLCIVNIKSIKSDTILLRSHFRRIIVHVIVIWINYSYFLMNWFMLNDRIEAGLKRLKVFQYCKRISFGCVFSFWQSRLLLNQAHR